MGTSNMGLQVTKQRVPFPCADFFLTSGVWGPHIGDTLVQYDTSREAEKRVKSRDLAPAPCVPQGAVTASGALTPHLLSNK
jgi:hypothetical protein